ncbi:hypothetical protein [Microbacterium sp. NPDC057650]|uniref:hypothetical protein n=1 Tax=unclassified Microbacterium TaxID=2609290 RepID=UPI00366B038F
MLFIVAMATMPIVLGIIGLRALYSRRPVEERYGSTGGLAGGAFGGLDAAFFPTAHEAGIERDRQTARTAPAPSPGDPPWGIDGDHIRIDV